MKVLQVLPALDSGGVEKGTLEIAEALCRAGHESYVLSKGGRLVEQLIKSGSKHINWDIGKKSPVTLLQVRKLRHWIIKEKFDVIHLRSRMPAWIVWLAWRKIPLKERPRLVTTVHGLHSVSRYSQIVTCGEQVIAVSQTIMDYITQNYPNTPKEKLNLIYRGIDPEAFPRDFEIPTPWKNDFYSKHPETKDKFIVCLPGRLSRIKGHSDLLEIAEMVGKAKNNVAILVVGEAEKKRQAYAEEILQKAKRLEGKIDIVFTGYRQDMKEIYALSDCILSLSSKPESFGRTVLEALSLGTPVIGYSHGGVGEILDALFPFGKCDKGNTQQVKEKILSLQDKPERYQPKENETFLLDSMQEKTLRLYEELTNARSPIDTD